MSLKSVHGDEPSLATQPKPWHTWCKPLSAVKVIFPLALLQFSSGWGRSEEVLFLSGESRTDISFTLAEERERRKEYSLHLPILLGIFSLLDGKPGTGTQTVSPKTSSATGIHTSQPHTHITPAGKPTKGPKSWWSPIITHPCVSPADGSVHRLSAWAPSAPAAMGVGQTGAAITRGWHLPSVPCKHRCPLCSLPRSRELVQRGQPELKPNSAFLLILLQSAKTGHWLCQAAVVSADCVCGRALGVPDF